jgi:hypothetical protein
MLLTGNQLHCFDLGDYFLYFFDGGGGSLVTGSATGNFCFLWGWRMLWWAGIHRPAAAAACQSFFYDFYKKLTELRVSTTFACCFAG